jgi:hypothetical protein
MRTSSMALSVAVAAAVMRVVRLLMCLVTGQGVFL